LRTEIAPLIRAILAFGAMSTWFYYDSDGRKHGPVTSSQLKELAQTGEITLGTMVKTEDGRSAVARKVKGLTFPDKTKQEHDVPQRTIEIPGMAFVALDFETANSNRNSACAVGLVAVENGVIVHRFYSLIKPPQLDFSPHTVKKHGITPEMVQNEKTFAEIYPQIKGCVQDKIVFAHNSRFDENVLNACLSYYLLEPCSMHAFACTLELARNFLPVLANHQLSTVAEFLGIEFQHHNALSDAEACAKIVMRLFWNSKVSFHELLVPAEDDVQEDEDDDADNDSSGRSYDDDDTSQDMPTLVYAGPKPDPQSRFFEKTVVFTMFSPEENTEEMYSEFVPQIGGFWHPCITKKVHFLVIADEHFEDLYDPTKATEKMKKAMEYREKGIPIEIISETEFLNSIETDFLPPRRHYF